MLQEESKEENQTEVLRLRPGGLGESGELTAIKYYCHCLRRFTLAEGKRAQDRGSSLL